MASPESNTTSPPSIADIIATPMPWRDAPVLRQVGVVVALAASVAVGVAVALWSQEPAYTPIFSQLSEADASRVATALKNRGSDFKLDLNTGQVLVPADSVRQLRMDLAAEGLPGSSAPVGLEMLNKEQDLTTSQFIETARYKHALENELARSIASLRNVRSARVHLAVPKESIFVRQRIKPSASVVLAMHAGRTLEEGQVAAIVHLVSSSIPEMNASQVTVVDQMGRLLNDGQAQGQLGQSNRQFDYTRKLEQSYSDRIVNLLEPLVGFGKVRAQVAARLDFTTEESASEAFDPTAQVIRSEQIAENDALGSSVGAEGVPGMLSNRPPAAGTAES